LDGELNSVEAMSGDEPWERRLSAATGGGGG
jgi:hypothetical protein